MQWTKTIILTTTASRYDHKKKKNTKHRQFQGKKLTIKPPQPTKKKEEEEKTQQHNQITYLGNALDAPVSHHMNPPRHQCDPKDRPHQNPRNQTHVPIVHSKFSRENQNIPRKYQRNTTRTQIFKKKIQKCWGKMRERELQWNWRMRDDPLLLCFWSIPFSFLPFSL